jgi:hypothetical protein
MRPALLILSSRASPFWHPAPMPTDNGSMRDDADHRRVTHERWVMMRARKQGTADYRDEWAFEHDGCDAFEDAGAWQVP